MINSVLLLLNDSLCLGLVLHIDPSQVVLIDGEPRLVSLGEARLVTGVPLHWGPLRVSGAHEVLRQEKHTRDSETCCAHIEVLLSTVEAGGVHSVLPADISVGHPDLLPVVGDGHPGEHQ